MSKIFNAFSYVMVGLLLAALLFSAYLDLKTWFATLEPTSSIYEASVMVPDFARGTEPSVVFSRDIHQTFLGSFNVEVKSAITGGTFCHGSGSSVYTAGEPRGNKDSFDWFVADTGCAESLPPGQYLIEVYYSIVREGLPLRLYRVNSNIFTVTSRK